MKQRKMSMRDAYAKKLKEQGKFTVWNKNGKPLNRKPLKKISKSQRSKLKAYFAVRYEFLKKPENRLCAICEARRSHGENILIQPATEVHHRAGRGRNLSNVSEFIASCFGCRLFPHENPRLAREWNLLK